MSLGPNKTDRIARARADLRMGVPVVVSDDSGALIVLAAETASPARLTAMEAVGGSLTMVLTRWRADTLRIRAYDGDLARIHLESGAPLPLVRALADPSHDLGFPMKGPFRSEREGSADLHRAAIALIKSAHLLPAAIVVPTRQSESIALENGLTHLTDFESVPSDTLMAVANAKVPLMVSETARLHVFRPDDGGEEHYAIDIGPADRDGPVLTRLHSACFTGDLLGSLKCDCGPQLNAALAKMGAEGAGILLYLNQEGRGIGLANKMRAYALQDQGFDTVEANHRLGFEDDERDFRIGASILRKLGVSSVRLMTNNPAKVDRLTGCGIDVVERVPLKVGETAFNDHYLATKAKKSGHLL